MSDNQSWITTNAQAGFGTYDGARDERLHTEANSLVKSASGTETQYFGFNSPEHGVHGFSIVWVHPTLGAVSGGVIAWQGFKTSQLACEMFDYRGFMGNDVFKNDLLHVELEGGFASKVLDSKTMHTSYRDDSRGNAFEIDYRAASPAAMRLGNHHFEQGMKIDGEITLRGKTYPIDSYTVRDRSWGEARFEGPLPMPPLCWLSGIFGDDFSFGTMSFEDSSRDVDWKGDFDLKPEDALKGGWVWHEGAMRSIVRISRVTRRDPMTRQPLAHDVTMWDDQGEVYELKGKIIASAPFVYWFNIDALIGLIQWEWNGRIGCGDSQEAQWTDYVRSFMKRQGREG